MLSHFLKYQPTKIKKKGSFLNISSICHFIIFVCYLVTRTSKLFMASEVFWQKLFHSGSVQVMELSPGDNIDDRRTSWGRNSGRTSSFTRRTVIRNWFSNPWIKWSQKRQYMWIWYRFCVWSHYIIIQQQNQNETMHNMMIYVHIHTFNYVLYLC